jgi:DNA-binding PadR family transcriptional regulator
MPKSSSKQKSPQVDKRSRTDLELFVLAMIDLGVNTPYGLHSSCGISPGASIPVLARLERGGYVRSGKPAARRRSEYEITPKGGHYLKEGWRPLLRAPAPQEMESILRIVTLAMMAGADAQRISRYLEQAASEKTIESNRLNAEVAMTELQDSETWDPGFYRWLLNRYAGARLLLESKSLRGLARALMLANKSK